MKGGWAQSRRRRWLLPRGAPSPPPQAPPHRPGRGAPRPLPRHPGHPPPTADPPRSAPVNATQARSPRTAAHGGPPPPTVANVAFSPALAAPAAAVAAVDVLLSPQVAAAAAAATRAAARASRAHRPSSFTGPSSPTPSAAAVVAPAPLRCSICCAQRHHCPRLPARGGHGPGRGEPLRRKH